MTPLLYSVVSCKYKSIEILLKYHCDINAKDDNLNTALIYSCIYNDYNICKILLNYSPKIHCVNIHGETALILSNNLNKELIIDYLFDKKIDDSINEMFKYKGLIINTCNTCNHIFETNECIICLNNINDKIITSCGHCFCKQCFIYNYYVKDTCALCRTELKNIIYE